MPRERVQGRTPGAAGGGRSAAGEGEGRQDGQRAHWSAILAAHPDRYGSDPSVPARYAAARFREEGARALLELGAGNGRDAVFFTGYCFRACALDYAAGAVERIAARGEAAGLGNLVDVGSHDVRDPLPHPDRSLEAGYAHMLFCMALTTPELEARSRPGSPQRGGQVRVPYR